MQAAMTLTDQLRATGFGFVPRQRALALLPGATEPSDWAAFAASWERLEMDTYLATTGRQRRRRHAVYEVERDGTARRMPARPHFQNLADNPLQGDIERWFAPVEDAIGDSLSLSVLLALGARVFGPLSAQTGAWLAEVHQFRIEARADTAGEPTPEGIHRDGVDFVLVALVDRTNIASGTTTVHTPAGELLGSFTLTDPLDLALVDDHRVFHGVTPVTPVDPDMPAHRDVLVLTYRALS